MGLRDECGMFVRGVGCFVGSGVGIIGVGCGCLLVVCLGVW